MRVVTNRLKRTACAFDSKGQFCGSVLGESYGLDTTGGRGTQPNDKDKGVTSWLARIFGMEQEAVELRQPGPFGSYRFSSYARYISKTSKVHDFFNSWHYDWDTGSFRPFESQLGAELFEVYSFVGMPVAGAYTLGAQVAAQPITAFKNLSDEE